MLFSLHVSSTLSRINLLQYKYRWFRPLSLLWRCFYSNMLNNNTHCTTVLHGSFGTPQETEEALKKMAGLILFTKKIWAAGLKIGSSHRSGVNDMVYVSIFTEEMTLKKSCLLSRFIQQLCFSSEEIFLHNYAGTKRGKINTSNWKWPLRLKAKQTPWGIFFFFDNSYRFSQRCWVGKRNGVNFLQQQTASFPTGYEI